MSRLFVSGFLVFALAASAATAPSSGTLVTIGQSVTWTGGPLTGSNVALSTGLRES
jgi:ABC-type proline/glycine betaine transport system substrate-binding protein